MQTFGVSESLIDLCWESIAMEAVNFHKGASAPAFVDVPAIVGQAVSNLRKMLASCNTAQNDYDPLAFYRGNNDVTQWCSSAIPVVKMLISVPGGESHCERVFSWAGEFRHSQAQPHGQHSV